MIKSIILIATIIFSTTSFAEDFERLKSKCFKKIDSVSLVNNNPSESSQKLESVKNEIINECEDANIFLKQQEETLDLYRKLIDQLSSTTAHQHVKELNTKIEGLSERLIILKESIKSIPVEISDHANLLWRKTETDLNSINIEINHLRSNWKNLHKIPDNSPIGRLLALEKNIYLPASARDEISNFKKRLPSYLVGITESPKTRLIQIETLFEKVKLYYNLRYKYYTLPLKEKFYNELEKVFDPLIIGIQANEFYKKLQIRFTDKITNSTLKYAMFGYCRLNIVEIDEAINTIQFHLSKMPLLYKKNIENDLKELVKMLTNSKKQITPCLKNIDIKRVDNGIQGLELHISNKAEMCARSSKVWGERFDEIKSRIKHFKENIINFGNKTDLLEDLSLNGEYILKDLMLLDSQCKVRG